MELNAAQYLDEIKALAIQAGEAIMRFHDNGYDITKKLDGSPVTLADQASEDIVIEGLRALTPDIPVIAEEQVEAGNVPDARDHTLFWLVDPLDGTREFIKGSQDFTVNIGLVRDGLPVFGLVYLPATKDLYYGGEGIGAFLNGQAIETAPYNPQDGLIIVGSANHPDTDKMEQRRKFLEGYKVKSYTTRGSSLKFCLIAEGRAHLYPRFVPTYEWDTAAAHAILLQTGGDIIDFATRKRLAYGKFSDSYLNGHLVTGTDEVLSVILPASSL